MARSKKSSRSPSPARRGRLLRLRTGAAQVRAGHPWIFRDADVRALGPVAAGDVVRVMDARDGSFLAAGLFDPSGTIAVRLFTWDESEDIDQDLIVRLLERALERRRQLLERDDTNAWRLVNAEGDGLPGLAIDLYGRYAIVKPYSAIWDAHLAKVAEQLSRALDLRGVMVQSFVRTEAHAAGAQAAEPLLGEPIPRDATILENGFTFLATVGEKHKTGVFLDARDNRVALSRLCARARVLNLFSYTAAYSVYAARAGAHSTTSVDLSRSCAEWAARHLELNGIDPARHELVCADVFDFLAKPPREPFDVVILDPPSFSTSKRNVMTARKGYHRLIEAACAFVRPGGTLACSSNTAQLAAEEFIEITGEATAAARRSYRITQVRGLPEDFPTVPLLPRSRYLKCVIGVVE
ncbi:MAG: class I SAM-dependent rRNA methyltransferase [Planctomycetota bacterium]